VRAAPTAVGSGAGRAGTLRALRAMRALRARAGMAAGVAAQEVPMGSADPNPVRWTKAQLPVQAARLARAAQARTMVHPARSDICLWERWRLRLWEKALA